jgi:hypothetical protein
METTYKQFIAMIFIMAVFASCKNDQIANPVSSLNVVNAAVGMPSVKVNTSGKSIDYTTYTETIAYGTAKLYGVGAGTRQISAVAAATPAQDLFNVTKDFKAGGLYSLYLTGQSPDIEVLYKEDSFPVYTDSVFAVRVINLSPDSAPLNVTLAGTPAVTEFSNLGYKQQSEFKKYAAKSGVTNTTFNFQVRDVNGTLLTSYAFTASNLTLTRFKSATLVIKGLTGGTGTNAPGMIFIGNY